MCKVIWAIEHAYRVSIHCMCKRCNHDGFSPQQARAQCLTHVMSSGHALRSATERTAVPVTAQRLERHTTHWLYLPHVGIAGGSGKCSPVGRSAFHWKRHHFL